MQDVLVWAPILTISQKSQILQLALIISFCSGTGMKDTITVTVSFLCLVTLASVYPSTELLQLLLTSIRYIPIMLRVHAASIELQQSSMGTSTRFSQRTSKIRLHMEPEMSSCLQLANLTCVL